MTYPQAKISFTLSTVALAPITSLLLDIIKRNGLSISDLNSGSILSILAIVVLAQCALLVFLLNRMFVRFNPFKSSPINFKGREDWRISLVLQGGLPLANWIFEPSVITLSAIIIIIFLKHFQQIFYPKFASKKTWAFQVITDGTFQWICICFLLEYLFDYKNPDLYASWYIVLGWPLWVGFWYSLVAGAEARVLSIHLFQEHSRVRLKNYFLGLAARMEQLYAVETSRPKDLILRSLQCTSFGKFDRLRRLTKIVNSFKFGIEDTSFDRLKRKKHCLNLYEHILGLFRTFQKPKNEYILFLQGYFFLSFRKRRWSFMAKTQELYSKEMGFFGDYERFRLKVETEMLMVAGQSKDEEALNRIVDYEFLGRELEQNILKLAILKADYFGQLSGSGSPGLLSSLTEQVTEKRNLVHKIYARLEGISENNVQTIELFAAYLALVEGNLRKATNLYEKVVYLSSQARLNSKNSLRMIESHLSSKAIVVISGLYKHRGQILSVNDACSELFGYTEEEMMDSYIEDYMPKFYAKRHKEYITRFYKSGISRLMGTKRSIYVVSKDTFIKECKIEITMMNSLDNGINILGVLFHQKDGEGAGAEAGRHVLARGASAEDNSKGGGKGEGKGSEKDKIFRICYNEDSGQILYTCDKVYQYLGIDIRVEESCSLYNRLNIMEICPDLYEPENQSRLMDTGIQVMFDTSMLYDEASEEVSNMSLSESESEMPQKDENPKNYQNKTSIRPRPVLQKNHPLTNSPKLSIGRGSVRRSSDVPEKPSRSGSPSRITNRKKMQGRRQKTLRNPNKGQFRRRGSIRLTTSGGLIGSGSAGDLSNNFLNVINSFNSQTKQMIFGKKLLMAKIVHQETFDNSKWKEIDSNDVEKYRIVKLREKVSQRANSKIVKVIKTTNEIMREFKQKNKRSRWNLLTKKLSERVDRFQKEPEDLKSEITEDFISQGLNSCSFIKNCLFVLTLIVSLTKFYLQTEYSVSVQNMIRSEEAVFNRLTHVARIAKDALYLDQLASATQKEQNIRSNLITGLNASEIQVAFNESMMDLSREINLLYNNDLALESLLTSVMSRRDFQSLRNGVKVRGIKRVSGGALIKIRRDLSDFYNEYLANSLAIQLSDLPSLLRSTEHQNYFNKARRGMQFLWGNCFGDFYHKLEENNELIHLKLHHIENVWRAETGILFSTELVLFIVNLLFGYFLLTSTNNISLQSQMFFVQIPEESLRRLIIETNKFIKFYFPEQKEAVGAFDRNNKLGMRGEGVGIVADQLLDLGKLLSEPKAGVSGGIRTKSIMIGSVGLKAKRRAEAGRVAKKLTQEYLNTHSLGKVQEEDNFSEMSENAKKASERPPGDLSSSLSDEESQDGDEKPPNAFGLSVISEEQPESPKNSNSVMSGSMPKSRLFEMSRGGREAKKSRLRTSIHPRFHEDTKKGDYEHLESDPVQTWEGGENLATKGANSFLVTVNSVDNDDGDEEKEMDEDFPIQGGAKFKSSIDEFTFLDFNKGEKGGLLGAGGRFGSDNGIKLTGVRDLKTRGSFKAKSRIVAKTSLTDSDAVRRLSVSAAHGKRSSSRMKSFILMNEVKTGNLKDCREEK